MPTEADADGAAEAVGPAEAEADAVVAAPEGSLTPLRAGDCDALQAKNVSGMNQVTTHVGRRRQ
jgi:hypothetical protein